MMEKPINLTERQRDIKTARQVQERERKHGAQGVPSNPVYARVGDAVLLTARHGVQRNLRAEDITREIREEHQVHLTVGELHLLLASRRIPTTESK